MAEPIPSSSNKPVKSESKDDIGDGPTCEKRRKMSDCASEKLEHRLGGILCCVVCLDLPQAAVYQCTNGHLMCAPCFTHLLADARLRDEAATCPNCRVEISKATASRNLAVEKTVSELPSECKYCARVVPRHSLQHHEEKTCQDRIFKFSQIIVDTSAKSGFNWNEWVRIASSIYSLLLSSVRRIYLVSQTSDALVRRRVYRRLTACRFACIGCGWRGPNHELSAHEAACAHPHKQASEVVAVLQQREQRAREENQVYGQVLDLLSYEKITFNDLQLKPYRTEEFVHKLYYETSRFSAFGQQWVVKAFVNSNQRDPTQSYERELSYQLILKSKTSAPLLVQWLCLRGPYGEGAVTPRVATHAFSDDAGDAPAAPLPLADPTDTNRLLSNKAIHFRLIMFQASK